MFSVKAQDNPFNFGNIEFNGELLQKKISWIVIRGGNDWRERETKLILSIIPEGPHGIGENFAR